MNHLLLLCLSIVHSGPAGFGVMPKEPRKTEGRRKYYIRQWLVINGPRLDCYTYEGLVCFKYAPHRLVRWHPNCQCLLKKISVTSLKTTTRSYAIRTPWGLSKDKVPDFPQHLTKTIFKTMSMWNLKLRNSILKLLCLWLTLGIQPYQVLRVRPRKHVVPYA